jgi:DNA polymerase III sliding clamp (beta) subunit (PCNA family)
MDETATVSATDRFISVTSGNFRLISSLIGYRYPDYQRAWPLITGLSVEFDRAALIRSVQRVSIVTDQTQMGVQITIEPNEIRLASQSKDRGACFDAIDATANGSTVSSFNHKYLLDVLGAFDCERLCAHFNDAHGFPLRFAEVDDPKSLNCMGIMPLRIAQITEERNAA